MKIRVSVGTGYVGCTKTAILDLVELGYIDDGEKLSGSEAAMICEEAYQEWLLDQLEGGWEVL